MAVVVKTCGHCEKVFDGDFVLGGHDAVGCLDGHLLVFRQIVPQRVVEFEKAFLLKLHGGNTCDWLGAGVDVVQFIAFHWDGFVAIGIAAHASVDGFTMVLQYEIITWNAHFQISVQHFVDFLEHC